MNKGYAIHIGVDKVDSKHYNSSLSLPTCVSDAKSMESIARTIGFKTKHLFDENATSKNVINSISSYFNVLEPNDILLISFSGHGSKVRTHETWNLYDRMLFDTELKKLWNGFKNKVRILVVSDSCHSGDIVRLDNPFYIKGLTQEKGEVIYKEHQSLYDSIEIIIKESPQAQVKLLAACDNENVAYILKNESNSVFTKAILNLWNTPENIQEGVFKGNYEWLMNLITTSVISDLKVAGVNQTPVILNYPTNDSFNSDKAFSI